MKDNLISFNILEKSADNTHAIYHSISKFGPMASPRESLVQSDFIQIEPKKWMLFARSIERDDIPVTSEYVRM
jgi:hypothetical protein